MYRNTLKTAQLRASLEELSRAGSPVDLSVAEQPIESRKVIIEQVGGIYESFLQELENGRTACVIDIAVTNLTSRAIDVADVQLSTHWGDCLWQWLQPTEINFRDRNRPCSFLEYRFPGKCGLQLLYDGVINQVLLGRRRLPGTRSVEGWLLGIGGRMPAELRPGQWLDLSLTIVGADYVEYSAMIQVPAYRLKACSKTLKPAVSLREHAEKHQPRDQQPGDEYQQ